MCLAIPMKIIKVKGENATVECSGIVREVNIQFLNNIKKGDYVILHAGFAIEKLDKKEAEETLKIIKENVIIGIMPCFLHLISSFWNNFISL
ncbi:MAG: HypC/HybG/HupF family hydrogenase formation chaperone [Candidatus Omnitrophica bacterium]|nr:HypC/HybG/HupF family hydrogenase formation chaperone [Candidatus Omnitrophota bacterium]